MPTCSRSRAALVEGREIDYGGQEIAWAAREWAEGLAACRPLVLGFEDVHWAEEPLLELIEHLASRVRDARVLILCLARPELLEEYQGWGGGRVRGATIELGALRDEEADQLVAALLVDAGTSARPPPRGSRQDRGQPALRRGDRPDAHRGPGG